MSNELFERVWIVQEIAAVKTQVLRYGDEELRWSTLSTALVRVLLLALQMDTNTVALLDKQEILSPLIMEKIRAAFPKSISLS